MSRKSNIRHAAVPVALALVMVGAMAMLVSRQPSYQGRSLNSWLQQCSDTSLMETERLAEAQTAVRAI